jgi:2-iminobutanoate/2-iminopropanoate deaminase
MPNEYINPDSLFSSVPYGFSQVVVTTGTKTIYVSGQTAREPGQPIADGLAGQTAQALRNVETALAAAGATLSDVAALRIYIVNYRIEEASVISTALKQFFPADRLPASTWIGIAALAAPEFLIEIEVIAVLE